MSTNYHTPIAAGADVTDAVVNAPLGQLDSALSGTLGGSTAFTQINSGTDTTLNISGGIITISQTRHLVDTEASAASDDLDTISGGVEGDWLILQCVSASRVVTIKHNTGNVYFRDGSDRILHDVYQTVVLMYDGFKWTEWNGRRVGVGIDSTLTISGGLITPTRPHHVVDTEGAAATDDLDTIGGNEEGQFLVLSCANAARVVVIKHGTVNIRTFNGLDIRLDSTTRKVLFVYDGGLWCEVNAGIVAKAATYNSLKLFRDMPAVHSFRARNNWKVKAAAATIQQDGIAAPTATGTPSASNDTDSTYINLLSGGAAGNLAGYTTATFNLVRRQHNPVFDIVMRTGAAGDIANIRFWIGLFSAAPTNVDTLAAGTSAIAFRYSTVAPDTGWTPVTSDGASQSTATAIGTVAASTRYLLTIEVDDTNGLARFRVNNDLTTERTISTTLPAAATELGASWYIITTAAAAKNWKFSRCVCEYD